MRRPQSISLPAACAVFFLTALIAVNATAQVVYVDKDNTSGVEDGASWANAFSTIQPALDAAAQAGGGEVWVAAGVYDEARTSFMEFANVDSGSLVISENVVLLGGFVGNETEAEERDPKANVTIIDGSKSLNGGPALSVVFSPGMSTMDGFVVQGGDSDFEDGWLHGAGIRVEGNDFAMQNCIVRNNRAYGRGGGMRCRGDRVSIRDCTFRLNTSKTGTTGGLDIRGEQSVVANCTFQNHDSAGTAALDVNETGSDMNNGALIESCTFVDNQTSSDAGATFKVVGSCSIVNCLFVNNTSIDAASGALSVTGGVNTLTGEFEYLQRIINCTFVGNSAVNQGSAIVSHGALPFMLNCIFWNNSSPWLSFSNPISGGLLRNSLLQDLGGFSESLLDFNTIGDPLFVNPAGNDYRLRPGSPAIDLGVESITETFNSEEVVISAPADDMDGNPRPLGNGFDIGAYEFDPEAEFTDPFDPTGDQMSDAADLQHVINQVLGTTTPTTDLNNDGETNAADIQLMINRVLGLI